MKKVLYFIAFLALSTSLALAQSGEIQGKVTDAKTSEGVPFANVAVEINGTLRGAQTDFDGFYSIKPVPPGAYDVNISFVGYATDITEGVIVNADKITFHDVQLQDESTVIETYVVKSYKVPLLKADETATGSTVTKEEIDKIATRSVTSLASATAGVFQSDENSGVNIRGGRSGSEEYYIDGMRVRGSLNLPQSAIEQLTVVTGGVPARYGDATSGIINITTRGASSKFAGGIELNTSQFLDAFPRHLAAFNLTGPLFSKKNKDGGKSPIMGFFLSGEYNYDKDQDPSAIGIWKTKDDVQERLEQNPLVRSETNSGFLKAVDFITKDSLERIDARENIARNRFSLAGKVNIQPTNNINITIGGNWAVRTGGANVGTFELFNRDHMPDVQSNDYRGFVRFNQRLGGSGLDEEGKSSLLQNIFYTVQFDYSKDTYLEQDVKFKDNFFEYGYVGQFNVHRTPIYGASQVNNLLGQTLLGYIDTLVTFSPYEGYDGNFNEDLAVNPIRARHNLQYFADEDLINRNINSVIGQGGLLNGFTPASLSSAYSLWWVPGTPYSRYLKQDNDQFRLTFRGSFDVKPGGNDRNKHAIEFGFEYEQRINRSWRLNPENLWTILDQNAGSFGRGIVRDVDNPILIIDGQEIAASDYDGGINDPIFNENDTITYGLIRDGEQSFFDRNFREKFGLGLTEFVNVFEYAPEDFSLDMLSPDEIFDFSPNSPRLAYSGYDYLGNKLNSQPAFEDFWTERDEETGILTRPVGAFRPIYTAGYIQDKFAFRDLIFNIGVRVDRFDANQKVPKDLFAPIHGTRKVGDVTNLGDPSDPVTHPSTVGEDFVVYVDDEVAPTRITGYRDGSQWYDANGAAIQDPTVIDASGQLKPYLSSSLSDNPEDDIKNEEYAAILGEAFEDYDPQISFMPRVAFSFNVTEEAIFFAHYDILTQRPGRLSSSPLTYYYFNDQIGGFFNNPNLRPERTIDYQVGYKQKLTESSALTLSGFYRELKDMVQTINVPFAYPGTYNTFGNVDFGTVKGFEVAYDLRRTNNVRLQANYSLQFADGTGSSDGSQANLINFNQPNLRTIFPLSFDARHTLNIIMDYRFKAGKAYDGPKIFGSDILSGVGLNLRLQGRSGTPYTRQQNPTPEAQFGIATRSQLDGSINGSRLPWTFRMDARFDKDFQLTFGERSFFCNVYLQVQNLLNAQNIIGVYRLTGSPDDDGYLTSAVGQENIATQVDEEAFVDQYRIRVQNPNNYSLPRRINLGLQFNF